MNTQSHWNRQTDRQTDRHLEALVAGQIDGIIRVDAINDD